MSKRQELWIWLVIVQFALCLHVSSSGAFAEGPPCNPSTYPSSWEYPSGWECGRFVWDDDNPQTVHRNEAVTLRVVGGSPPFTWSVSGKGFSLSGPTGNSNVLRASSTACGSATVRVTEGSSCSLECGVRCVDAGRWVLIGNFCGMAGPGPSPYISGKYKQEQKISWKRFGWVGASWNSCSSCEKHWEEYGGSQIVECLHGIDLPGPENYSAYGSCYKSCNNKEVSTSRYTGNYCCRLVSTEKFYEWKCP